MARKLKKYKYWMQDPKNARKKKLAMRKAWAKRKLRSEQKRLKALRKDLQLRTRKKSLPVNAGKTVADAWEKYVTLDHARNGPRVLRDTGQPLYERAAGDAVLNNQVPALMEAIRKAIVQRGPMMMIQDMNLIRWCIGRMQDNRVSGDPESREREQTIDECGN